MASNNDIPPTSDHNPAPQTSNLSSSELRFPVPEADTTVANWIQHIPSANMSSRNEDHDDESSLAGSTYEFIDTDGESRDGNATASIASTDLGPQDDDVASLADTEQSEEESGDEDGNNQQSSVPALRSLSETAAFNTPTIGRSSHVLFDDIDKSLPQSIEFEEPFSLGAETVSVKHTVEELDEAQTASTVKAMTMPDPPERLSVTIRQTMTKQGLSTRDPLRILYVGSHSAKQDIIHKIASSLAASGESGTLRQSQSQLYNVVPVSAFRSEEIELMHSSGYQIKVEDCTSAESMKYEDKPDRPDVIKLVIDESVSYHSVPEGKSYIVEPSWELPHVAVFYCWSGDSVEAKRTRTLARKFMSRHAVPCIVISHKTLFDRGNCMALDQHAVHMCLESRDAKGRGSIIRQRFPIDLSSFLNIDARQMNRNLAYLTGLHEPSSSPNSSRTKIETMINDYQPTGKKDVGGFKKQVSSARDWTQANARTILPIGLLILSVLATALTSFPSYRSVPVPAISINSKTVQALSISSTPALTMSSFVPSITSISSSQAVKTSTRTITVIESPRPNSLSILPSMEIGKLPKATSNTPKSNKPLCTAEILGDREILIRIPSATKLSWLTKDAMAVNITRNNVTVDTERAYSSDEGIVLQLPKNEAYGLLNISIITTRKPMVNATFQVDFGTTASQAVQNVVSKICSTIAQDITLIDFRMKEARAALAEVMGHARSKVTTLEEVKKKAAQQVSKSGHTITDVAKSFSFEVAKRSAIVSKEISIRAEAQLCNGYKSLQKLQQPFGNGLLKAQVKSKLVWLQIQGKHAEYEQYKKLAAQAVASKQKGSLKCGKPVKKSAGRSKKSCTGKRPIPIKKART